MKDDASPSKVPAVTGKRSNGNKFASHAKALQAAIQTVSELNDFDHARIKLLANDLCAIDFTEVHHATNAKFAVYTLYNTVFRLANLPAAAWKYRQEMGDLLNNFVDVFAGGHGDFDAQICPNGSVVFVGELDPMGELTLREDQGDINCLFRPYPPYVYFVDRKTGEVLATNGMKHAATLLIDTRRELLELADVDVWYKRFKRLSLRRRKS